MKNKNIHLLIILFFLISCSQKPDLEAEKQKLLALHAEQQKAHLGKNATQFVEQFADSMISVNRGKISMTDKETAKKRFQSYFDAVTFKKWEDVSPPIIEFSEDGTMAYMIVDKMVILNYIDEEQKKIEESTHFAWVSIFKKQQNGEWKIVCNVSTNEPEIKSGE